MTEPKEQPMTWAEFMKRAHERPLPRAVLDDLARLERPDQGEQEESDPS
jgi:hypothetical protein